jgi:hypothetical protein
LACCAAEGDATTDMAKSPEAIHLIPPITNASPFR